jgi:hypothetical protein
VFPAVGYGALPKVVTPRPIYEGHDASRKKPAACRARIFESVGRPHQNEG